MENEIKEANGEAKPKTHRNRFIFKYLRNILTTKSEDVFKAHVSDEENINTMPSVVMMRYLSMCPDEKVRRLVMANQLLLERLDKTSHVAFYRWCIDNVPRQADSFIKYIK